MRKLSNRELNRKHVDEINLIAKSPFVIVLDNVRSLNNIGSVFRTADAFLAEAVYLAGICAQPPHREIHKTALGATETVQWKYFQHVKDAILELKKQGFKIILIEQTDASIALENFKPSSIHEKYALVFGNEVQGISDEILSFADYAIEIQQFGTKHSINIAVCAGIVIHHFFHFMKK